MTTLYFLLFLAFMAILVAFLITRYLQPRVAMWTLSGFFAWLVYVGLLSHSGVVANSTMRPPGALLVVAPIFLFVALGLTRSSLGARAALAFPLWLLLSIQVFRVGVELLLHRLWTDGLVPRLMTYAGGNVDIFVGLSAPLLAWVAMRGRTGWLAAMVWNFLGLASLGNIIVRSTLTAPGPLQIIHGDVPNLAIGTFPYTFIAGFFAPLALAVHIVAIRALKSRLRESRPAQPDERLAQQSGALS